MPWLATATTAIASSAGPAARLDDIANYLPARIFATLVAAVAPDRTRAIRTAVRRDARAHPSPNAGVAEAAVAGALGRELGGPLRYGATVENAPPPRHRSTAPPPADIPHAIAITAKVEAIIVAPPHPRLARRHRPGLSR